MRTAVSMPCGTQGGGFASRAWASQGSRLLVPSALSGGAVVALGFEHDTKFGAFHLSIGEAAIFSSVQNFHHTKINIVDKPTVAARHFVFPWNGVNPIRPAVFSFDLTF